MSALTNLLGSEHVLTELAARVFFSTDIFSSGATAQAVVRPANAEQLSAALMICADAGFAVVPRGGGFSYTGGYTPISANTIVVDLRRLDRIVDEADVVHA